MDIILSYNNNEVTMVFPVVPNNMPEIVCPQSNGSFDSTQGEMNAIGPIGLRSLSVESIFPTHNYPWLRPKSSADGRKYVDLIEAGRRRYIPFRVILLDNAGNALLNMACTVDNFTYHLDRAGDIAYKLELREYRFMRYKAR